MPADLIAEYRRLAATGKHLRGLSVLQHAAQIGELIRATGTLSVLDWGAGAGDAYRKPHRVHQRWGVPMPVRYDPAFPKFARSVAGERFDGVICTDVLEHIPEVNLDAAIQTLFGHAQRFVFASVCCRPAEKTFADGTNLHVTLRPLQWWLDTFEDHATAGTVWHVVETP